MSFAFGVDAATATVAALATGFVVERLAARIVGSVSCGLFCASLALMVLGQAWPPLLFSSTVLFGAGVGLNMVVQGVIWAQYYGWRFVGTIRGVVLPVTVLAGGLGAPLAGALHDASGTYRTSWLIVLVLCAVAGGLIFSARPPRLPAAARRCWVAGPRWRGAYQTGAVAGRAALQAVGSPCIPYGRPYQRVLDKTRLAWRSSATPFS